MERPAARSDENAFAAGDRKPNCSEPLLPELSAAVGRCRAEVFSLTATPNGPIISAPERVVQCDSQF